MNGVEGRTWNLNLRLSFFLGRGVRKYKSPGHVTVPVPHIPFATRSGAMQSPDGRAFPLSIHTDRALRRFLCVLRRVPLPFRLRQMPGGRLPAASLSGRNFHGPYPLGSVRRPLPERGGPAGSGRQKNRTGPTVPARWFAMPCVGKAGLRSESQNVQKLREALGLPGASAGRPYGTEPLLRGDGRPALSVSLF